MGELLVLWDIDHTLTENNGVNKEIYRLAFETLTGRSAEHRARTDGRTEPVVMRNMLIDHGIEPTADLMSSLLKILNSTTASKIDTLRERGHELPGAREVLTILQSTRGVVQSVLTGNTGPNAIVKLSAFGLDCFIDFEVGGYGSDHDERARLVAFAQQRASAKFDASFDSSNTLVIGDTTRDVEAGLNGGAHVIAVASGSDGIEELRASGAEIVLPDLRDTEAVVAAVTRFRI
ncbi:HAD hydrolase-like protein [Nocardia sp. NPDC005978]|uniref:HAD family hydrolase n=1 Tax=Nocardia sp. NPDC005978 TaxID=3156725 RepID=UPI0033B90300